MQVSEPRPLRLLALLFPVLCLIADPAEGAERSLNQAKAEKKEVRYSMMGPRDTLLFYTFAEQGAVLRLRIANQDASFPVTGTVFLFDDKVTKEGLAKWLNNQHSDGIFVDPAEPKETIELPEGACSVVEKKLLGEKENEGPGGGSFADYELKIAVKDHKVGEKFELKGFEDKAGVFLKVTKS
ncbi:hypothetical protein [Haloferula sp. A504]|uniref:hypothetical protein n=1 Tax=Haloferula sp. A504 TaxID=3373601 RepID=UPI0031C53364|nr:hypothetical protein [Verrucomicrobiaceae bacterium E54]